MQLEEQGAWTAGLVNVDEGRSLTLQQQFCWGTRSDNESLYKLYPMSFLLIGAVDVEFIRSALELLIHRNDALRTKVFLARGVPRQRFSAPAEYHLEIVDVSEGSKAESDLNHRVRHELRTRFARRVVFESDPLFSATLFRVAGERHVLVFWIHHILFDGYTLALIAQQFWALYAGLRSGRICNEERPMQYSEYCAWQECNYSVLAKKHQLYWKNRLSGAIGIQWPNAPSDSIHKHDVAENVTCFIGPTSTSKLNELAKRSHTHLSIYVLAAYAAVIRAWCNQRDFVLTIVVSGRARKEHLPIVGYLVQPLYLRVQTEADATFDSILRTVGREYLSALLHMDFGETMLASPDLCSGTLFQWFPGNWRTTPLASLDLGFRVEQFEFSFPPFVPEAIKLGLGGGLTDDRLWLGVGSRLHYFPRSMIDRLLEEVRGHLECLAEGLT